MTNYGIKASIPPATPELSASNLGTKGFALVTPLKPDYAPAAVDTPLTFKNYSQAAGYVSNLAHAVLGTSHIPQTQEGINLFDRVIQRYGEKLDSDVVAQNMKKALSLIVDKVTGGKEVTHAEFRQKPTEQGGDYFRVQVEGTMGWLKIPVKVGKNSLSVIPKGIAQE